MMNINGKNFLIVRTDRIGDVVLTIPALKALRAAYPDAVISMLVAPQTRELVDGHKCLDAVFVDDRRGAHRGLFGFLKLIALLRQKRFDCAFIFHTKRRNNLACFLAGIPVRAGYRNDKFGFLLNRPLVDARHSGDRHEARYCLDVLRAFGLESQETRIDLPVDDSTLRWADRCLTQRQIAGTDCLVAIHAGASDPSKRWPERRFAELIDALVERYAATIVLVGADDTRDISRSVISWSAKNRKITDLTGQTTVGQLAGLLKRCHLLVSNDSGPVHIAAGVGTPVVSIFTRNQPGINPERWRPLGERARVVSVAPIPGGSQMFKKAAPLDAALADQIPTAAVLEAVDSLFKLC